MKKTKARICWELIVAIAALVVSAAALVVSICAFALDKETYNSRYDADAVAAGAVVYTFKANGKDEGAQSFTSSAGDIDYGYFQSEGTQKTDYTLSYKKTSDSSFKSIKTFTIYSLNNYTGDFDMTVNNRTCRYDLKLARNNNRSGSQTVEIDWGVK